MRNLIEFTQYIAPDGTVYNFETEDKFLMSETGLGLPPIAYITQKGPFQHGESVLDYRLRPRVVQLVHRRNSCSREAYWTARSDILNHIRPNRHASRRFGPGTLRKVLPNGDTRDLHVLIEQGPEFAPRDLSQWDEYGIYETLRFVAHDPIFYDPVAVTTDFVLSRADELVFYNASTGASATSINFRRRVGMPDAQETPPYWDGRGLIFALGIINQSVNITYTGTWNAYPSITITGPLSGPLIHNLTTGELIHLDVAVPAGDTLTIALTYGAKSVTNAAGVNLIGTLTPDSNLSTFHLAPDPEAPGGVNQILVTGAGATPATAVSICHYTTYIGI